MLPNYLWKIKVEICDMLRTRWCLVDLLWCPSAFQSLASRTSSLSIHGWRSTAAITVTCSCHSSCCPWCVTCQTISSSFGKTAHLHTGHATLCDFLSSQHPSPAFVPPDLWLTNSTDLNLADYKMWGDSQQRVSLSIPATQRWQTEETFAGRWHGMDQTVIDDVLGEWRKRVVESLCGQKADISSNYSVVCRTVQLATAYVLFNQTWCLQFVANLNFDFPWVMRKHILGVVGYIMWILFTIYFSFQQWRNFENRLSFNKVIAISCGPLFFWGGGHSVIIVLLEFTKISTPNRPLRRRWKLTKSGRLSTHQWLFSKQKLNSNLTSAETVGRRSYMHHAMACCFAWQSDRCLQRTIAVDYWSHGYSDNTGLYTCFRFVTYAAAWLFAKLAIIFRIIVWPPHEFLRDLFATVSLYRVSTIEYLYFYWVLVLVVTDLAHMRTPPPNVLLNEFQITENFCYYLD